jgi:D-serine deaminase-like pyridoxal phosphate-dependent protein
MSKDTNWFEVLNSDKVLSPSLLLYKDRVAFNIRLMISIAGSADRLIPHVKTHKMAEIVNMQMEAGISMFKCATIAEAEMLAKAGAKWVLIAYQMVGPNIQRLASLKKQYSDVHFASLVDSFQVAQALEAQESDTSFSVFVDINNGMNRSGHPINEKLNKLLEQLMTFQKLRVEGLHVYDGHIREQNFEERRVQSDADYEPVSALLTQMHSLGLSNPMVVAGGSPTFTVHALRNQVYCSPGTCLLWDWGYGDQFLDQPFQHAALLATRVISRPAEGIITVDLGHKAVAAENPIGRRFQFLNLTNYEVLSQSEEHGVIRLFEEPTPEIGTLLYAVPYHVCPTVALHASATIIENQLVSEEWPILARTRKISI